MSLKKILVPILVIGLVAGSMMPATAGKKKKKKPKPYKSEEGMIVAPHTLLFSATGEVNSVTAREFENRCAIPATNGLDAYVYEVPPEYQKIAAKITAKGNSNIGHDFYIFFYDKDCVRNPMSVSASAAIAEKVDAEGVMPKGTAWVLIADFCCDPATLHYELKP